MIYKCIQGDFVKIYRKIEKTFPILEKNFQKKNYQSLKIHRLVIYVIIILDLIHKLEIIYCVLQIVLYIICFQKMA